MYSIPCSSYTLLPHLKRLVYSFTSSAVVICGLLYLRPSVRIISVVSVITSECQPGLCLQTCSLLGSVFNSSFAPLPSIWHRPSVNHMNQRGDRTGDVFASAMAPACESIHHSSSHTHTHTHSQMPSQSETF